MNLIRLFVGLSLVVAGLMAVGPTSWVGSITLGQVYENRDALFLVAGAMLIFWAHCRSGTINSRAEQVRWATELKTNLEQALKENLEQALTMYERAPRGRGGDWENVP